MISWINFTLKDFIDVFLVALSLYYTYQALKSSGSRTLFTGIITFVILWVVVSRVFEMTLMGALMNQFMSVGFILLVILFQDDIRRFLSALGSTNRWKFLGKLLGISAPLSAQGESTHIAAITLACMNMSKKKIGALIVIEQESDLEPYEHTGEIIHADINARLIENIFFKNSPLHDGAMIVSGTHITAVGCILPLAQNIPLPKEMGLRHRAGLGMSLQSDAKVIIISEERGKISIAYKGRIVSEVTSEELQRFLSVKTVSLGELTNDNAPDL